MKVRDLRLSAVICLLLLTALTASAQDNARRVTFNVGGGVTPLTGAISDRLETGYNFTAGAGLNLGEHFTIGGQFLFNGLGVNPTVLQSVSVPTGDANVWSITAQPTFRLAPRSRVSPYIVGGVGYYRRTVHFTQPTVQQVFVFDPFFGVAFPGLVSSSQILAEVVRDGIGGNLGAGFEIGLGTVKFFTEARYHYADTGAIPTRMVPVTFGLRF